MAVTYVEVSGFTAGRDGGRVPRTRPVRMSCKSVGLMRTGLWDEYKCTTTHCVMTSYDAVVWVKCGFWILSQWGVQYVFMWPRL